MAILKTERRGKIRVIFLALRLALGESVLVFRTYLGEEKL